MGIWNWIVESVSGREEIRSKPRTEETGSGGGVALLDAAGEGQDLYSEESERWWATDDTALISPDPVARPEHFSSEARALENILASHFDSHDLDMPPFPRSAEKVVSRLSNLNHDSNEVASLIAEDPVISAAVLRMANSVLYGGIEKITAIKPAITRLGSNSLRTLMLHQSCRAAIFQKRGSDPALAEITWNRALASGCVMRALAHFTKVDQEEAFMIGLLHDMGNVIVLRETQGQQAILKYRLDFGEFEFLCYVCHQEFGELVADAWGLPDSLKQLISTHHEIPAADDPLRNERWMLHIAYMVNAMIGYGPEGAYNVLNSQAAHELGLTERPGFEDFLFELPGLIELHVAAASF